MRYIAFAVSSLSLCVLSAHALPTPQDSAPSSVAAPVATTTTAAAAVVQETTTATSTLEEEPIQTPAMPSGFPQPDDDDTMVYQWKKE